MVKMSLVLMFTIFFRSITKVALIYKWYADFTTKWSLNSSQSKAKTTIYNYGTFNIKLFLILEKRFLFKYFTASFWEIFFTEMYKSVCCFLIYIISMNCFSVRKQRWFVVEHGLWMWRTGYAGREWSGMKVKDGLNVTTKELKWEWKHSVSHSWSLRK